MTPDLKWLYIRRLESTLANGGTLSYPQAPHDAMLALQELRRYKADAEFLREEKALVWRRVAEPDRRPWWRRFIAALARLFSQDASRPRSLKP